MLHRTEASASEDAARWPEVPASAGVCVCGGCFFTRDSPRVNGHGAFWNFPWASGRGGESLQSAEKLMESQLCSVLECKRSSEEIDLGSRQDNFEAGTQRSWTSSIIDTTTLEIYRFYGNVGVEIHRCPHSRSTSALLHAHIT